MTVPDAVRKARKAAARTGDLAEGITQAGIKEELRRRARTVEGEVPRSEVGSPGLREIRKEREADRFAKAFHEEVYGVDEVRKEAASTLARDFVEEVADSLPGAEVEPDAVLKAAHSRLLRSWLHTSGGRPPQPEDAGFWSALSDVSKAIRSEMERQGV